MNILVSSAGRRGALVRLAQQAVAPLGGKVFAIDAGTTSSACRLADGWSRAPRCTSAEFADVVLELCQRHEIRLLIPTIDTELPVYARERERFARHGVTVAVSGPAAVRVGCDKLVTHRFLCDAGLPTVRQYDVRPDGPTPPLPAIIKPRRGSGSNSVQRVDDEEAFWFFWRRTPEPIVQQVAQGNEYTVNFFVDRGGRCLAAAPHRRLETRAGEVSKCVTVRHEMLIALAERMTRALPDAFGPLCYQAFVDDSGDARIIELNPRFGGGYPVAHAAGADFLAWLVDDALGRRPRAAEPWRDGVAMLRYDEAVFTTAEDIRVEVHSRDRPSRDGDSARGRAA